MKFNFLYQSMLTAWSYTSYPAVVQEHYAFCEHYGIHFRSAIM